MAGDLGMKVTEREKMEGAGEAGIPPSPVGTACGCALEAARDATGALRGGCEGGGRGGRCRSGRGDGRRRGLSGGRWQER